MFLPTLKFIFSHLTQESAQNDCGLHLDTHNKLHLDDYRAVKNVATVRRRTASLVNWLTELLNSSQSLKVRCVYDVLQAYVHFDLVVDRIVQRLHGAQALH